MPGLRRHAAPPDADTCPAARATFAALAVATLESFVGRPSPQRKPWSDTIISTPPAAAAASRYRPIAIVECMEEALGYRAVFLVLLLRDRRLSRRCVRREHVPDGVGALEVDDRDVGMPLADPLQRQIAVDARLDQHAPERADRLRVRIVGVGDFQVVGLAQPRQVGVERAVVGGRLRAREAVARPRFAIRGKHDAAGRRRFLVKEREQPVGYDEAVDRFRRERRPQAEHRRPLARFGRHVPDRRRPPLAAGDRLLPPARRIELDEVEDAVLQRARPVIIVVQMSGESAGESVFEVSAGAFGDEAPRFGITPRAM